MRVCKKYKSAEIYFVLVGYWDALKCDLYMHILLVSWLNLSIH